MRRDMRISIRRRSGTSLPADDPLRAGALAPHKQSISLKSGDKMRVIPAFHRSSFEVGIACDFCFEDGA
jgi:hypothetical protein